MDHQQLTPAPAPPRFSPEICHRIEAAQVAGECVVAWAPGLFFREHGRFVSEETQTVGAAVAAVQEVTNNLVETYCDITACIDLITSTVDSVPARAYEDREDMLDMLWLSLRFCRALSEDAELIGVIGDLEGRRGDSGAEIVPTFQRRIDADRAASVKAASKQKVRA